MYNRVQLKRQVKTIELLRSERYPNRKRIVAELGKSVAGDLDELDTIKCSKKNAQSVAKRPDDNQLRRNQRIPDAPPAGMRRRSRPPMGALANGQSRNFGAKRIEKKSSRNINDIL